MSGLRLMVYDRTCRGRPGLLGLSHIWQSGSWLYRGLDRIDGCLGVETWPEAFDWLMSYRSDQPIAEIQYWGHGKWGRVAVDKLAIDRSALAEGHSQYQKLCAIRERLIPGGEALWWFRTCEAFGADAGHDFAKAWTDFFGCPAAGHTYIIGFYQSGLHRLVPGARPHWSAEEGLAKGSAQEPLEALWSKRRAPNTITALRGAIPASF